MKVTYIELPKETFLAKMQKSISVNLRPQPLDISIYQT